MLPNRDAVIRHRVVITTLATSKHLLQLNLNHGFFSHILVDEAAQALEPEALTPLVLAGPNTKVVFTGDHMQVKIDSLRMEKFRITHMRKIFLELFVSNFINSIQIV